MALSIAPFPSPRWTDGEEGHVHAAAIPAQNLATRELRRVPGRPPARLRREQGQAVVRLRDGPPDETDENPIALRAVHRPAGVLAGRKVARGPIGLRGRR